MSKHDAVCVRMNASVTTATTTTTVMENYTVDIKDFNEANQSFSALHPDVHGIADCLEKVSRFPVSILIVGNVYLCINIVFTWLTNITLITVIIVSPNLRTPPNSHLINICVNSMLLSVCMALSVVSTNLRHVSDSANSLLAGVQIFIVTNAFLQYWNTFTAIGYYRLRTIKKPSLSTKIRREIIRKSITASWFVSVILSLVFTFISVDSFAFPKRTLSPFRFEFPVRDNSNEGPDVKLVMVSYVILAAFLADLFLIVSCYYRIVTVLDIRGSVGKNRVTPWHRPSLPSDSTDLTLPTYKVYKPMENNWIKPYTVSENFIVHFQNKDHTLDFEDAFALENPIVAASIQKRQRKPLQPMLSNASTTTTKSRHSPDFTDISAGAELQRVQKLKNNSALRNQFLKRDRISLGSATKNSLVMCFAFIVCSVPLFICTCPGILSSLLPEQRLTALAVCRYLFYLNGPVYPTWYLCFSKRVKKCLTRVTEHIYLKCKIRR